MTISSIEQYQLLQQQHDNLVSTQKHIEDFIAVTEQIAALISLFHPTILSENMSLGHMLYVVTRERHACKARLDILKNNTAI